MQNPPLAPEPAPALLARPLGYGGARPPQPGHRLSVQRSGDDRYLLYTGGTTGLPKGVVWRHEALLFSALGGGNANGAPAEVPAGDIQATSGSST